MTRINTKVKNLIETKLIFNDKYLDKNKSYCLGKAREIAVGVFFEIPSAVG